MSNRKNEATDSVEKVVLNNKLNRYFDLRKIIHEAFGYVEDWVVIPIEDYRDQFWQVIGGDERGLGGRVIYSLEELTPKTIKEGTKLYSAIIYAQRFLPKWIYRTEHFTMIAIDTQSDGNKFFVILDNKKEQNEKTNEDVYIREWMNLDD